MKIKVLAEIQTKCIYLPGGGLPSKELMVERAVRGIKLGLQEDAAIGYGLQRGGTFIGEAKSNEQLDRDMEKGGGDHEFIHWAPHIQVNNSTKA